MNKSDIIRKLTSRKFWVALAALVSGIVAVFCGDKTAQIVGGLILQTAAVIVYVFGEGMVDAAHKPPDQTAQEEGGNDE